MFFHFAPRPSRPAVRAAAVVTGGLLAAAVLGACGGSSAGGSAGSGSGTPSASGSAAVPGSPGGPAARGPAASGLVAAVTGTTMQVQNPQSGQVGVTWTATTTFSHTVAAALASVKAGACVTAVAPSGTSATAAAFRATTVLVSAPVNGSCTGGFRTGTGGSKRPSGFPSRQRPSGAPPRSGFPSGASGRAGFGTIAIGKVTSVSGSTIVVAARSLKPTKAAPQTTPITVTIGSGTKITMEAATTAAAVKVGECVTAQGKADSTGTVTATSVRITAATKGQCTIGFGGGPTGG